MEGKAVLFKKFANIDCFDIEVNEKRPGEARRDRGEPGADLRGDQPRGHQGAGLLRRRAALPRADEHPGVPRRPARHGDRGRARRRPTRSGWRGRRSRTIKIVSTGGGAAGIACLNMLMKLGARRENIWLCDIHGLVYAGRERGHEPGEGGLRPEDATLRTAGRGDRRGGPLPRAVGAGRADRRDGAADGARTRSSSRSPTPTPRSTRRRRGRPTRT